MDSYEFLKAQQDEIIEGKVNKVAELIYDWVHNRKQFSEIDADYRYRYLMLAREIVDVVL